MKKFLSLVLALVMTMSLVTISAGAKDFADDSDIDYKAAVDVISELGVVDGYSDNSFRPDGLLTRGAAAKIICNLILGPTTASALSASTAPFKDVPTTNVFAGYITYCAQQGIISGYGDGTFRPTGTLTGNAFMKMLLGALGYDASIEGYTGANWQVNVVKQAIGIGLDDGNDNFVGSKSVTRGEAALYAFNMLQATMVEYDQQNTIVVGDITINTTSSRKEVANTGDEGIENDNKMQFAERYFTDLSKRSGTADEFERPSTTWRLKSRDIGTYADEADVTYTASVELGDIYSDLGLTDGIDGSDVTYFVDGADKTKADWDNTMDIVRGSKKDVPASGNGVLTEVFYDEDNDSVTITVVNTYVGEVNAVRNDSSTRDAYITVKGVDGYVTPNSFSGHNEFETESFDKDDVVAYTFSEKEKEIQSVELAEAVTGAMTRYTNTGSVTVAGNKYDANKKSSDAIVNYMTSVQRGTDVTAYLDQYGYLLYVDGDTSKDYAVVVKLVRNTGDLNDEIKADLLLTTGEVERVTIDKDSPALTGAKFTGADLDILGIETAASENLSLYDIVSYTINGDDEYEITRVADAMNTMISSYPHKVFENGRHYLDFRTDGDYANNWGDGIETDRTDGATTFLFYDGDDASMYEGFANVPTATVKSGITYYSIYTDADNAPAEIVFVYEDSNVDVSDGNEDVIYIKGMNSAKTSYDTELGTHYEYDAFLNGEEITLNTEVSSDMEFTKDTVIYAPDYNSKGLLVDYDEKAVIDVDAGTVNDGSNTTLLGGKTTGDEKNSVIELAGISYTYTDDVAVYYVDVDGNLITGDIAGISDDDDDLVAFALDDGRVATVYIKVVDETSGVDGDSSYAMSGEGLRATASKQNFAVDFTTETALDSTYTVTVTITRKDNSMGDATVATKTVNAGSGTSQKIDTTIAIPADGNYVAEIVVRNSSNNVVASGETASTFVPAP